MQQNKIYGLDGLRFISAVFVILNHYYVVLESYGYNVVEPLWIDNFGHFALQYFFCGSGFLISHMLLLEQKKNNTIRMKYFYLRRVFRIWPAYLILISIVYFFVYTSDFFYLKGMTDEFIKYKNESLFFFILMVPHLNEFFGYSTAPFLNHTYTVGLEEQFYIIWSFAIKYLKKYFFHFNIIVLLLGIILELLHYFLYDYFNSLNLSIINKISTYFKFSQFTSFSIGGLLAFYYQSNHISLNLFKSKKIQLGFYVGLFWLSLFEFNDLVLKNEIMSFLMCFVLFFATFKMESIINYSHKTLEFLGQVSYGIYLFHYVGIVYSLKLYIYIFEPKFESIFHILFSIVFVLSVCIIQGIFSFYVFEKYFIKIKDRFKVR